ncbi:hypothetical protein OV203_26040 [Nannocystis sp. ILAH1]|uniref:hypothetical protein n=1 Tax=Nannocystis sp. ILAH1 TaxID=2996789 RepID=UPI00226FEDB0|nr:hypothetical protein [Nannocystis sp. ILAH1]MCY0990631.1 hypothetical protein [Nannocystis sp. ILAH1]
MDWGRAYEEHQRDVRDQLHRAQAAGVPCYRLASGPVDPRRLRYSQIAAVARRDAEVIVNESINRELEAQKKRKK